MSSAEGELLRRVLDALLREDHRGFDSRGALLPASAAPPEAPELVSGQQWWRVEVPGAGAVLLPVRVGGFLADRVVCAPLLVIGGPHGWRVVRDLAPALAALDPADDDAELTAGWADFVGECADALTGTHVREAARQGLVRRLAAAPARAGFRGMLELDALAALVDHPVHPTSRARHGLSAAEQQRFGPEFQDEFRLRWVVVPRSRLRLSEGLDGRARPQWWLSPSEAGVRGAAQDDVLLPVHPLTAARHRLDVVPEPGPLVVPTLSMRTVALVDGPGTHLKLPLPTATLGRRNRRTIKPGTLADGALVQALLGGVLLAEPALASRVLLADESVWVEGADEHVALLVRRYPADAGRDRLVPLAALLAEDPRRPGGTVLDAVAEGDVPGWFAAYVEVLLDWHVALLLRYGTALEAHQQNITVAIGADGLRLIYKDNDGARIDRTRWPALRSDVLGPTRRDDFADQRIVAAGLDDLLDLFTTMTLHLGIGAIAFGYARGDGVCSRLLLRLAEAALLRAIERWRDPDAPWSTTAADGLLRRLDERRWPVKAMVTAGTLLPKQRLGCTDVNKYYRRSGPNYLRWAGSTSGAEELTGGR